MSKKEKVEIFLKYSSRNRDIFVDESETSKVLNSEITNNYSTKLLMSYKTIPLENVL